MNAVAQSNVPVMTKQFGLVERFGMKYGVEGTKVLDTLKTTCFKGRDGSAPSNAEMMTLLIVADQYNLNPFTKEIYAFQAKGGGIAPVVGVDGWDRICNDHPKFDGVEFRYSEKFVEIDGHSKSCPEWCEAWIYRTDRTRPTIIREYLDEVYVKPTNKKDGNGVNIGPWQTHTKRFLRHKAFIQCARIAFGFSGIYDEDEALNIAGGPVIEHDPTADQQQQAAAKTGATSKLDAFAGTAEIVTSVDKSAGQEEAKTAQAKGKKNADANQAEMQQKAAEKKPDPKPEPKGDDPTNALFGGDE